MTCNVPGVGSRRRLIVAALVAVVIVGAGIIALRASGGGGQDRTFNVSVVGGAMSPETITVRQNDTVTLVISADRTEEIHLHGYDIKHEVKGGGAATYRFKADRSGDFEIEIENSGTTVGHLVVNP